MVWVFFYQICLYAMCVPQNYIGQKRVTDTLEFELQLVMRQHVGAGN